MSYFELKKHTTNEVLFAGHYPTFSLCLEDAVTRDINLSHINLSGKNLINANLDNAQMPYAVFDNANLTGANLSEANLYAAHFKNCPLFNTCFAYSSMEHCDFSGAEFGATHISGASIDGCIFSTLSCFDLDLPLTKSMDGCAYIMPDSSSHLMTSPPIVVKGLLNTPVILLDHVLKIGDKTFPKTLLPHVMGLLGINSCAQNIKRFKLTGDLL